MSGAQSRSSTTALDDRLFTVSFVRVISCLLILRGHYFSSFGIPLGPISGAGGPVSMFFVISGFLAYLGYERSKSATDYYRRRIVRLVPKYYAVLLICMIVGIFISIPSSELGIWHWIRYISFTSMWTPSNDFTRYNAIYGFWTLSDFAFFYLLTPLLHRLMACYKHVVAIIVATVVLNPIQKGLIVWLYTKAGFDDAFSYSNENPLATLYLFVFGMAAAFAWRQNKQIELSFLFGLIFLGMLLLVRGGYVMWALAAALLCLNPQWHKATEILDMKPLKPLKALFQFIDENSLEIYILHLPIFHIETTLSGTHTVRDFFICIVVVLVSARLLYAVENTCRSAILGKRKENGNIGT